MFLPTWKTSRFWFYFGVFSLLSIQNKNFGYCESESNSNINYGNDTESQPYRYSRKYHFPIPEISSRMPRLFSFEANDGDVKVDLEFVVPFFRIPIKRSMEVTGNAFKSLVNFNGASLIMSGLFVLVGAFVGLIFNSATNRPVTFHGFGRRNSRINDDMSWLIDAIKLATKRTTVDGSNRKFVTELSDLVETMGTKFRDDNFDISTCMRKFICEFIKKTSEDIRLGRATGTSKIIDGFVSLNFVRDYLSGTAINDAIEAAQSDVHCKYVYHSCKMSSESQSAFAFVDMFLNYFR